MIRPGGPSGLSAAGARAHCDVRGTPPRTVGPPFDQFLVTPEAVAQARHEVDLEMARDVFQEAAGSAPRRPRPRTVSTHTTRVPLCWVVPRSRLLRIPAPRCAHDFQAASESSGNLHDREAASAAYLVAARILESDIRPETPRRTGPERGTGVRPHAAEAATSKRPRPCDYRNAGAMPRPRMPCPRGPGASAHA
jgi:hypothetical protein